MRWSLTTSIAAHAIILLMALVVLPNPDEFKVSPQKAIQVDITNITNESKQKAVVKEAVEKPKELPAPKKTETVKKAEPAPKVAEEVKTAVVEAAAEPPPPEPKKTEPKKEEPKPLDPNPLKDLIKETVEEPPKQQEPPKKAEVKPKPKPEKKPEKKKPKFDPDQIAAFLNKTDEEKTAPQQPEELAGIPELGEQNIRGADDAVSADIVDALVSRVRECWTVPPGAREANLTVRIHFRLNPDGSVAGQPEVENWSDDPLFAATARSAVSALLGCQAYSFLPQDRYELWQDNTLDFNPNLMFDS